MVEIELWLGYVVTDMPNADSFLLNLLYLEVRGLEESDFLLIVAAHERYDNYLRFFALEIVHRRYP
jgi:hypothetical protein